MFLTEFEKKLLKNFDKINPIEIKKILKNVIEEKNILFDVITSVPLAVFLVDSQLNIKYQNDFSQGFLKGTGIDRQKKIDQIFSSFELNQKIKANLKKVAHQKKDSLFFEVNLFDFYSRDLGVWIFLTKVKDKEHERRNKVVFIADLTQWKNKTLEKNQKDSISSLYTLTAGIAHEIKNPLGALDLHLQLIKRFIKRKKIENKQELEENIVIINNEIKRLDSIINDFLYSFRPIRPIKKPQKLSSLVSETLSFIKVELQEKKIILRKKIIRSTSSILLDKDQIKQMLINLLKNSIAAIVEYQEKSKGLIKVSLEEKKDKVILTIQDNGIGIPRHEMVNVFKPFYTTKKMGTGLGLSIVSRIVKEHHGELILNSNYKKGTEIIVEFKKNLTFLDYKQ